MNHKLLAARAPLAWIVLGLVVLVAIVQIVAFSVYDSSGLGLAEVTRALVVNPLALLVLILLALSCLATPEPRATLPLAISVAVLLTVFTAAQVVQVIGTFQNPSPPVRWQDVVAADALGGILPLLILSVLAWVLVACSGSPSAPDTAVTGSSDEGSFYGSAPASESPGTEETEAVEHAPPALPSSEDHAPTWELDKASGVVWQSAAAAATGQQGSGYGMPGQLRGTWQAAPALQAAESLDPSASADSAEDPEPHVASDTDDDSPGPEAGIGTGDSTDTGDEGDADGEMSVHEESGGGSSDEGAGRRFAAARELSDDPSSGISPSRD